MTREQWTHYTLARAYARGVMTSKQIVQFIALYRGLK